MLKLYRLVILEIVASVETGGKYYNEESDIFTISVIRVECFRSYHI